MAKFYGKIGYAELIESPPESGIWKEAITVRSYYGELTRNSVNIQATDQVLDNVNLAKEISIIADPYAYQNFHAMRYVEFMGAKWKITRVEVQRPRLLLTVGGVYNGQ